MIYFIQAVDGGPIKIGTSKRVSARIKQLECEHQRHFVVMATLEGGRDEERSLHKRFAHLRYKRTEFFRPAQELMDFIGKPLFVPASDISKMSIDANVRLDAVLLRKVKYIANFRGKTVAEYLTESLAPIVDRDMRQIASGLIDNPPKK